MEMPGQLGLSEMINAMAQPIYAVPATATAYPIEAALGYTHPQYVQQGHFLTPVSAALGAIPRPPHALTQQFRAIPAHNLAHAIRSQQEAALGSSAGGGSNGGSIGGDEREEGECEEDSLSNDDRERDERERRREREYRREREHRDRRDRDRGRDRDRERDRRDRDYDKYDRRSRDRDRRRDRDRDSPSYRRDRDSHYRDNYDDDRHSSSNSSDYKSMPPNNTIMVRGLAQHITENDIREDIIACGLTPKDIRLVRRKESGASRGFAFVEFSSVHDATKWMETKQGVLLLNDAYRATLQYSIPKDTQDRQSKSQQDWICVRCGVHNFKRRDNCFKCSAPRHESDSADDGSEEACNYPTYKLVLRGLDVLSTEEGVLQAIQHASTDLPIKSVRIGRDPLTNISRGVCFVELDSVYDAMTLFNKLMGRPPTIDGKQINISYCKLANSKDNNGSIKGNNYGDGSSSTADTSAASGMPNTTDVNELAEYSARLYASTPEEHATYLEYYKQYYTQQQEQATQSDSVNAAAAVAQSALQAVQQKTSTSKAAPPSTSSTSESTTTTSSASSEYPVYPTPDVSTYQYDESSGYYYDSCTGLYYDASSSYYYNAESGQYLYWDSDRSTYMPAPASGEEAKGGDKKEKDRQDKVKVAKKIAKDMERWAKAQNKKNEKSGGEAGGSGSGGGIDGSSGTGAADAAFAVLLDRGRAPPIPLQKNAAGGMEALKMTLRKEPPTPSHLLKKSGLVAAYGDDGGSDQEEDSAAMETAPPASSGGEEEWLDRSKKACLLCKRQFPNLEGLEKHVKLSNLHKSNLEAARGNKEEESSLGGGMYRDRAEERRKKYGMPNKPPPNKLKEKYMSVREEMSSVQYEEPTKKGIGADNIGNKLLKKMGWNDGQGLGKSNQGRTDIIEAERRVQSVGLGVQGSSYSIVGDTYKECVKKMMYHRYQELDQQERE